MESARENFAIEINTTSSSLFNETLFEPPLYRYNVYVSVALSAAYALVFIAGFVGNILVIIAVVRGGRMVRHSVTNIFLANLAFADLLVIVACLPFTLISHLTYRKQIIKSKFFM